MPTNLQSHMGRMPSARVLVIALVLFLFCVVNCNSDHTRSSGFLSFLSARDSLISEFGGCAPETRERFVPGRYIVAFEDEAVLDDLESLKMHLVDHDKGSSRHGLRFSSLLKALVK